MPFVISAVVLGFAGAAGSQLFAAVHDDLQATASPVGDGVVSIVRMALTAGWIVGPVVGLTAGHRRRPAGDARGHRSVHPRADRPDGLRARPPGPARRAQPRSHPRLQAERPARRPGLRVMLPLLAFTGLYVLVYAGEPIKYGYLTIYMHNDMHLPTAVSGAVIGIQPLIELILMPVAVVVARRIGMMRLMVLGAAFGVGANLCFALTGNAAGMFAGQILMGGVWGVFAGTGNHRRPTPAAPSRRDRLGHLHELDRHRQRPRRADRQPRRRPARTAARVPRPGPLRPRSPPAASPS